MFLKITNPETNRKIQINTRLGRRIIRNYINRLSGGAAAQQEQCRWCGNMVPVDRIHTHQRTCSQNPSITAHSITDVAERFGNQAFTVSGMGFSDEVLRYGSMHEAEIGRQMVIDQGDVSCPSIVRDGVSPQIYFLIDSHGSILPDKFSPRGWPEKASGLKFITSARAGQLHRSPVRYNEKVWELVSSKDAKSHCMLETMFAATDVAAKFRDVGLSLPEEGSGHLDFNHVAIINDRSFTIDFENPHEKQFGIFELSNSTNGPYLFSDKSVEGTSFADRKTPGQLSDWIKWQQSRSAHNDFKLSEFIEYIRTLYTADCGINIIILACCKERAGVQCPEIDLDDL